MALTPLDIHNKEFTRGFRGYDEDEVNDFLDQVIKDFEAVIREKKQAESQVEELHNKLKHFSNIEETLNKSIIVAQETAEDVKQNASKEGKLIVKEAEKNADRIVNEALAKSRKIALEIEELKKQAKVYRTRFRMLVEAQLEMLDDGDWERLQESMEDDELLQGSREDVQSLD
ncbi:MAG TPA: DivIVA domain-containing protein [Bacillales bacterium]